MQAAPEVDLMARSFEARIGDAERIVDPIKREVALQELQDEFEQLRKRIADGRAKALWEANVEQGISLRKLGQLVGLSHPAVQHFVDRGKLLAAKKGRAK